MSNTMHTPTPWWLDPSEYPNEGGHYWLVMGEHGVIANIGGASQRGAIDMESNKANAAFIVEAVNAHDGLVAALRKAQLLMQEELDGILECACQRRDDGTPIRCTIDEGFAPLVKHYDAVLAEVAVALAKAEGRGIKMDLSGV